MSDQAAPQDAAERIVIPVLSAANFVVGMGAFMVIGMIPPVEEGLGLTTSGAGWIMTIYALAYVVASPTLVALTGRVGRRKVVFTGMSIFALASFLAAAAPNATVLFSARALAAVGAGMMTPVAAAIVAGLVPPERRARSLAAVFFGMTVAQVFGVPAGSYISYTFGWRTAFVVVGVLTLPCLWLIWTRVPRGLQFQPVGLRDLGALLTNGKIMLAVLFTATFLGAIYVPFTYIAPLLEETMGYGRDGVALVLFVFGVAAVVGNVLGGWMADQIGPGRTLTILAIAQSILMVFLSFLPLPGIVFFALLFAWSAAGWSFTAPQQARVIGLAPDRAPVVLSLNAAAIYVGTAAGAAVGGVVIDSIGIMALGIGGGLVGLLAVANILISRRVSGG